MASPSLRQRLRESTAVEHQRLDSGLRLSDPTMSREDYGRLLQAFYTFYAPLERQLREEDFPQELQLKARLKAPLLEKDLSFLGLPLESAEPAFRLKNAAEAWGYLYVVEGSTLGGQLLRKHFAEKWGFKPGAGLDFFCAYGEKTPLYWRAFIELLEKQPASFASEIEASATRSFAELRKHLTARRLFRTAEALDSIPK